MSLNPNASNFIPQMNPNVSSYAKWTYDSFWIY